jgi:hypothetical protein
MSDMKRREFVKKISRWGLVSGFVLVAIQLGTRSFESESGSASCSKPSPCLQCGQFGGCTQPRALAQMKKTESKSDSLHNVK